MLSQLVKERHQKQCNGDQSKIFGVYKTLCYEAERVIGIGVLFPDCPTHKSLSTEWKHLSGIDPAGHELKPGKINLSDPVKRK